MCTRREGCTEWSGLGGRRGAARQPFSLQPVALGACPSNAKSADPGGASTLGQQEIVAPGRSSRDDSLARWPITGYRDRLLDGDVSACERTRLSHERRGDTGRSPCFRRAGAGTIAPPHSVANPIGLWPPGCWHRLLSIQADGSTAVSGDSASAGSHGLGLERRRTPGHRRSRRGQRTREPGRWI